MGPQTGRAQRNPPRRGALARVRLRVQRVSFPRLVVAAVARCRNESRLRSWRSNAAWALTVFVFDLAEGFLGRKVSLAVLWSP
jgi:hypothetical protein